MLQRFAPVTFIVFQVLFHLLQLAQTKKKLDQKDLLNCQAQVQV